MTTVQTAEMKINTLAPWFGSNRVLAQSVGEQLGNLAWCGVPFCGGCPELPYIRTRGGVAADMHRHIINLARCVRDEALKSALIDLLDPMLFHPDEIADAQRRCVERESRGRGPLFGDDRMGDPDPQWGADYFAASWMGRGGHAGKATEFSQSLATRWTSGGGDSAKRFRSAIDSLMAWHETLRVWSFERLDVFEFLASVKDQPGHGLYIDAPWPVSELEYKHRFDDRQQAQLADRLARLKHARVVVRYGDHPLIRSLYPKFRWTWIEQKTRDQQNGEVNEVLIINGDAV